MSVALELPDELVDAVAERVAALLDERSAGVDDPWFTVPEAAEYMRCKPQRIYDLISQGHLHADRDGRRRLIRRSELDRYLTGRAGG